MLCIRYSPPDDLEISGDVSDLAAVADGLHRVAAQKISAIRIPADDTCDRGLYVMVLSELVLQRATGLPRVAVICNSVEILGAAEGLDVVASYFEFPGDAEVGEHHHLEYYEGATHLLRQSCPVIITIDSNGVA